MKHYLLGFSILILGVSISTPTSFAQESTTVTPEMQQKAEKLKNLIQKAKQERDQLKEQNPTTTTGTPAGKRAGQGRVVSQIKTIAEARGVGVMGRYVATLVRLENINNRLGIRTSNITESGKDTTEAQKLIMVNAQILAQVNAQLGSIKSALAQEITVTRDTEKLKNLRAELGQVREALKTVWNNEREIINLLKAVTTSSN